MKQGKPLLKFDSMKKLFFLVAGCLFALTTKAQCPINITGNTNICTGQGGTILTATSMASSYTWVPGGINSSTISINPSVTTTYTVYGTNGACTDSATVIVNVSITPTITASANPNGYCPGYSTVLSASGATTYTWDNPAGLSSTSGPSVSCNTFATTNYTVTGANGWCYGTYTLTVVVWPSPTATVVATPASCSTLCDGILSVNMGGGTPPYSNYYWNFNSGISTSPTATAVCAGGYTFDASDANGCYFITTGYIAANNPVINTSFLPATCGLNDGSISVTSVQGASNLKYNINGGSFTTNSTFINLNANSYTIGIKDTVTNCIATTIVALTNSNFTVQLTPTAPGCSACNGALSALMTGGTPPYSFTWSSGANTSIASNLCAGNYHVSVIDNNGCFTYANANLISTINTPIIHIDSIKNIICNGITTGSSTVSVTGGTAPYSYLWNTAPAQTTHIATGLQVGYHNVVVTDNIGCSASQSIYISNSNNIYVYSTSVNPANCSINGSASINALGGQTPYAFNWSNGAIGQTASNLIAGTYTVTSVDANGCSGIGIINISSLCLNIIKGRIYNDSNQNCMQDAGELGLQNETITVYPGNYYGSTNATGDYAVSTPNMTNTVIVTNNIPYYSPTCPITGSLTASFSTLGDTSYNNNFGYFADPNYFDLSIHPGWSSSYPGSTKTYWFLHWNKSNTPQYALVRMVYDSRLQYTGCTNGGVHFPSQHKIEWTYNNLPPTTYWYNYNWLTKPEAYFNVPVSLTLNDTLFTHFEIQPTFDANPSDNVYDYAELVTGSHDPNEKTVYPKGIGATGNITRSDSVLFYTIHFQNNGNDTAYRVVVVDTLSSFLDPASIIPGAANHKYKFNLSGQGICTWTFDSIMLPDSLHNEPASNGYFNFTVRQKPNNPYGSVIKNTADIYFDFNSAVVTNTTVNTITAPLFLPEINQNTNSFVIYPNPTSDNVILRYQINNAGTVNIEFRNILGELVKTQTFSNKQTGINTDEFTTNGLPNGVYLVRIVNGNKQQSQKLIIQR
jgi:hypothetical protein